MTSIQFFRETVGFARSTLEDTFKEVEQELAAWTPGPGAMPMAAHYAHVVADQDYGLHGMVAGTAPLIAGAMAGRAGVSSPPPMVGQPFDAWAAATTYDLAQLREYAQAVYAASDEAFAKMTEADLARPVDMSAVGFGMQPLSFILTAGWIANPLMHAGEISLLKGLRGQKGYPF